MPRRSRARYDWVPIDSERDFGSKLNFPNDLNISRRPHDSDIPVFDRTPWPMSMDRALTQLGLPESNLSPDNELIDLLLNAAEIEHGLMVQYLYAAAATDIPDIAGRLRQVAIEEMGHFITVQNLLISFGADPHLSHSDWTETSTFKPFPFKLEPASRTSLAKYAIAEMPDAASSHMDLEQLADLPAILADARVSAGKDVESYRVGLLYMKIYWLLRASDDVLPPPASEPWLDYPVQQVALKLAGRHISDGLLKAEAIGQNAVLDHWKGNELSIIVRPISTRESARQAIADISAQGEGFAAFDYGHFDRFVEAWRLASKSGATIAPVAENPWYVSPGAPPLPAPRTGNQITNPLAVAFARIGDKSYEAVVLVAALYLLLPSTTAEARRRIVANACIRCMKNCLKLAIANLSALPLSGDPASVLRCGLPYLQERLAIPPNAKSCLNRVRVLKDEILEIVSDIMTSAEAGTSQKYDAESIGTEIEVEIWKKRLATIPLSNSS